MKSKSILTLNKQMAGIIGRTYTLNIELPEPIDGYSQYKASDKMMPVGKIDSINEVNVSDDKFFNGSYSNGIGVG